MEQDFQPDVPCLGSSFMVSCPAKGLDKIWWRLGAKMRCATSDIVIIIGTFHEWQLLDLKMDDRRRKIHAPYGKTAVSYRMIVQKLRLFVCMDA